MPFAQFLLWQTEFETPPSNPSEWVERLPKDGSFEVNKDYLVKFMPTHAEAAKGIFDGVVADLDKLQSDLCEKLYCGELLSDRLGPLDGLEEQAPHSNTGANTELAASTAEFHGNCVFAKACSLYYTIDQFLSLHNIIKTVVDSIA